MRMGSLYFASDKAIFDALTQRGLTAAELRKVFLSRGIVISNDSDKKFLASRFSALFHDYYDYRNLSLLVGGRDGREKTTCITVTSAVSKEELTDAANSVKEWVTDELHEHAEVTVLGDQVKLTVKYQKLDFTQAEFRQVVEKTAEIVLEKQKHGWKVTGPMNEKFKELTEQLYSQIEIVTEKDVSTQAISLAAIADSSIRTSFLRSLIRNLKDMEVDDVIDVSAFNPSDLDDEELISVDRDLLVEDNPGDESDDEVELETEIPLSSNKIIKIDKASLKGKGVLESKQLMELEANGFYLWKIKWKAKIKNLFGADIVEFEAQFANQVDCSDFSYIVKGVYRYTNGQYSKSRVRAGTVEEQVLKIKIEQAAQKTLQDINLRSTK